MDESGFEPEAYRRHGYARRGLPVYGLRSGKRGKRTNLLAAQRDGQLIAPLLFEGSCNTDLFGHWVEHDLCPLLTGKSLVIMDNASFHKSLAIRTAIEATGATLLFVAPYSPDLNPIEKTFGAIKRKRSYEPDLCLDDLVLIFC